MDFSTRTRAQTSAARAISVWLRADLDVLWERVRDRPGRPLLQVTDPRAVLADLHRRRAPIYSEADVIVDGRSKFRPITGRARDAKGS